MRRPDTQSMGVVRCRVLAIVYHVSDWAFLHASPLGSTIVYLSMDAVLNPNRNRNEIAGSNVSEFWVKTKKLRLYWNYILTYSLINKITLRTYPISIYYYFHPRFFNEKFINRFTEEFDHNKKETVNAEIKFLCTTRLCKKYTVLKKKYYDEKFSKKTRILQAFCGLVISLLLGLVFSY